jgi:F0F1-type ATP synthase epsilon subunit
MYLEIITPEQTLFKGEVDSVLFPGSLGDFQVLNNHAPIVSTLKKGEVKIIGKLNMILQLKISLIFLINKQSLKLTQEQLR